LTKIQYADHEQDNCLLEYEQALELSRQRKAHLFVLSIGKEVTLGKAKCVVKFLSTQDELDQRRKMYAATGNHHHKKGPEGPLVSVTMGELLSQVRLYDESEQESDDFAYLDPEDIPARIPDILRKLDAIEGKQTIKYKAYRIFKDIAFLETKLLGVFLGTVLPGFSLICTLSPPSPRQTALRFGIFIGHGLDFLIAALIAFVFSGLPIRKDCDDFFTCVRDVSNIVGGVYNTGLYTICYADDNKNYCTLSDYNNAPTNSPCVICFCNNWDDYCEDLKGDRSAYLFIGMLSLVVSFILFAYAAIVLLRSTKKQINY